MANLKGHKAGAAMAFVNAEAQEINCKIVYVGASGAGKSENLKAIFQHVSPEIKTGVLEFDATYQSTKYFDFLPISMGQLGPYHLKLHLFTLPVHCAFNKLRPLILRGLDAFVLVVDTRMEYMAASFQEYSQFRQDVQALGNDLSTLPGIIQYNKRDLPDILPIQCLQPYLNEGRLPEQEAIASKCIGTMDTLNQVVHKLLEANAIQVPFSQVSEAPRSARSTGH